MVCWMHLWIEHIIMSKANKRLKPVTWAKRRGWTDKNKSKNNEAEGHNYFVMPLLYQFSLFAVGYKLFSHPTRVFHKLDEIGNNANIGISCFTTWKIHWQNVTPSGNRTLAFAGKTETLGSLYSHALLIPTKSSKSKHQVVHGQKFKDLPSSTWQERRVLDLESEVMRGLGSIPTGGNILSLDFFSCSKAFDANIGIIANFV